MRRIGRALAAGVIATVAIGLAGTTTAASAVPAGDGSSTTVPRPPFDSGTGSPIARTLFASPDGSIACRRVYTEMVWLECLLRDSSEVVVFGPDESWTDAPCVAPNQSETCRLAFGMISITPATRATKARFAGARPIPLERQVELGRRTVPYPVCIADPNLGLSCSTQMDDQVGQQIFLGLAGSIWNCPGYEYVYSDTPVAKGHDRCLVVRE